jgi:hypothetical protein
MQDTRRVHSELFRHLDLIEHVADGLIDADQGKERLWGRLRVLKELMNCGCPSYHIEESVSQLHEFWPVSIAWTWYPRCIFEEIDFLIIIIVIECHHFMGSNTRRRLVDLIDMKFRDRLLHINSFKGFVDLTFRLSHVIEEARTAYDKGILAFSGCIFMASVHNSVPPDSRFIIAINALNCFQRASPLLVEVLALKNTVMIRMVTFYQDRIWWEIRSVIIRRGRAQMLLRTFLFLSNPSAPHCDNLCFHADWFK